MKAMWLGMVAAVVIAAAAAFVLDAVDVTSAQTFSSSDTRL